VATAIRTPNVMPAIESPCVKICVLDAASGLCGGCGRTTAEITGWLAYTPAQRRAIMATLPARMKSICAQT
jgi:uncharacterized protein